MIYGYIRKANTCFVAEDNEKLIGVIMSGHDGRRGFIYHTTVRKEYRGQGIGKKLVDSVIKALEAEGIHKAALVVFEKSVSGNAFWEKVGFAVVQYIAKPESPYNEERRYFHIEEFGVDEKHRRKGIAAALIDFIKEDAKNRGFKRIELDMWEFNDGALAFYESAGLKTYRRYMESYTDTEEGNRT